MLNFRPVKQDMVLIMGRTSGMTSTPLAIRSPELSGVSTGRTVSTSAPHNQHYAMLESFV
jgi:hypothetical protein